MLNDMRGDYIVQAGRSQLCPVGFIICLDGLLQSVLASNSIHVQLVQVDAGITSPFFSQGFCIAVIDVDDPAFVL